MGLVKEFKEFALKGNVLDMAIGIIIGAAFGTVVSSLVNDVVTPPLGKLIGGVNFSELRISLGETTAMVEEKGPDGKPVLAEDGKPKLVAQTKEAYISYGRFLQALFNFVIVALAVFAMVKVINNAKSRMESPGEDETTPAPPEDIQLLREIRDALNKS